MDDTELNPDYWNADGSPIDNSGSSGGGTNWSQFGSSLFSAGGSVLTQALKNQTLGQQTKLAKAQASNSSATIKIVILAVVGLAVLGLAFAFLKRR